MAMCFLNLFSSMLSSFTNDTIAVYIPIRLAEFGSRLVESELCLLLSILSKIPPTLSMIDYL